MGRKRKFTYIGAVWQRDIAAGPYEYRRISPIHVLGSNLTHARERAFNMLPVKCVEGTDYSASREVRLAAYTAIERREVRRLPSGGMISVIVGRSEHITPDIGDLPPICEQTITVLLLGLTGQVEDFSREAAREVFNMLRPTGRHYGGQYKTNSVFRVGRQVILPYRVESGWGRDPWHVTYTHEQGLTAVDGIFHLLAGRGVMRQNKGPLVCAINSADASGRGETEFFRFKCFKNRNLHLEFKRLDLVKELNFLAAGERVLGADVE